MVTGYEAAGIFARSTGSNAPLPQREHSAQAPDKPQPKSPSARDSETRELKVKTSNYSITPGPVWLEATNEAALNVATVNPARLDLPLQGSGFMWRKTNRPIVCAILPPPGPPFDQEERFGDEAHAPEPPDYHWWPALSWQPISAADPAKLDPNLPQEQLEKMQQELKQKQEEEQKKAKEAMDKAKQQHEAKEQEQPQPQQEQARVVAPPGVVDEWLQRTGMSANGFPGFPRSLGDVTALPVTAGISRVELGGSDDERLDELVVRFVGTGTIPAGCRWLFFTLQGV